MESNLAIKINRWSVCEGASIEAENKIDSAIKVWEHMPEARAWLKEHFIVLGLSARSMLIMEETISIGTLTASLIHPRELFRPLVAFPCAAFIAVHNHPSGDPSPSPEDRQSTERLRKAAEIMGIPMLDHVIISKDRFFSFRDSGLL